MNKKISILLNFLFGIIFIIGIGTFFSKGCTSTSTSTIKQSVPITQTTPNFDGLITSFSTLLVAGLKLYYERRKNVKTDNTKHPIFQEIHELLVNEVKHLDLGATGRTAVFKLMLQSQLRSYENNLQEFVKNSFDSAPDFREKSRSMILNTVNEYEQAWRDDNIPEEVISRYKTLQEDRIKLLLSDVDTISFYRLPSNATNFDEVIFYLLTHISVILRLSVTYDSLKTLKELNGTLKKLTFNGMPL